MTKQKKERYNKEKEIKDDLKEKISCLSIRNKMCTCT